jgi:hypothetical protein
MAAFACRGFALPVSVPEGGCTSRSDQPSSTRLEDLSLVANARVFLWDGSFGHPTGQLRQKGETMQAWVTAQATASFDRDRCRPDNGLGAGARGQG